MGGVGGVRVGGWVWGGGGVFVCGGGVGGVSVWWRWKEVFLYSGVVRSVSV